MNNIKERLESKKAELEQRKVYFSALCNNEMDTKNFEKNAITELLIMQQLKSEISELERIVQLMNM